MTHACLIQVYIAAIAGHVPPEMVKCMSIFMEMCYIFRRNTISSTALNTAQQLVDQFHILREVFIHEGVCSSISLPRQHALIHYLTSIVLFGSLNGLCSSITESKHIKAVKEPWRRSSRFKALVQMLRTIIRLEKLAALRQRYLREGMLVGSTASHFAEDGDDEQVALGSGDDELEEDGGEAQDKQGIEECSVSDAGPDVGPQSLSYIILSVRPGKIYL